VSTKPTARAERPCGHKPGLSLAESSERDLISRTLRACNGNVTATASALGLAKSTVYAKLHRYDICLDLGSANAAG
jgi:sigma-54 dependent transcriptional regulator, acetoin dehydrogenase operon transcriptional activator AcoR